MTLKTDLQALWALWPHVKARGTGRRGRPTRAVAAVNRYERELVDDYAAWASDAAKTLNMASDRLAVLDELLTELQSDLITVGREQLPEAMELGLGSDPVFGEVARALADALDSNERYIRDSLIPAIREKVTNVLADDDIAAVLGGATGEDALQGVLLRFSPRVAMYAGAFWTLYNRSLGQRVGQNGGRLRHVLDHDAQHCHECPIYGDRDYDSFEAYLAETGGRVPGQFACLHKCRCELKLID